MEEDIFADSAMSLKIPGYDMDLVQDAPILVLDSCCMLQLPGSLYLMIMVLFGYELPNAAHNAPGRAGATTHKEQPPIFPPVLVAVHAHRYNSF